MNKINKLFAGFAAVAMLAACSNDEPTPAPNPGDNNDGEVAYMTITISAPETGSAHKTGSRATENGGYVESDATPLEHEVKTVDFLFFNSDGAYAFTVKANDATFVPTGTTDPAGTTNVEYLGKSNIVILEGVRQNNYPEYVMTILNRPSDFAEGATLQETADKLTAYANSFVADAEAPFVMTTSSFLGNKNGDNGVVRHDAQYFVTKLGVDDFKLTLEEAQKNTTPVEIYVERLAAKVQLGLAGTTENIGGKIVYKLQQTLAGGEDNTEGDNVSDVDLYVGVEGWRLNATAIDSYMSKKLDTNWTEDKPFTNWNNADDWRSFWGQAHIYTTTGTPDASLLKYETPKNVVANLFGFDGTNKGNIQYCYENTNNPEKIFAEVDGGMTLGDKKVGVINSLVTHVVLKTKIYQLKDGALVAPSLVQFRGILYTEDSYKAMLLNGLKAAGKLNYWRKTTSGDVTTYNTVKADDFEMVAETKDGHKLGEIKIVAKTLAEGDVIYAREDGKDDVDVTSTFKTTVDTDLANLYSEYPAIGTDDGDALYYIPVEHLAAKAGETKAVEGYYGVVRNHWYNLTVNSFKKVGHLVFQPDKDETPIIPENPEDPLYYVGAKINILSWKVVNQTVDDL